MLSKFQRTSHIFWGISSFQVLAMFRRGLFYAFLSIYLKFYLGMSVTETTLFATFPMILNILAQNFVWGKLSDKFQLRRTLIVWGEFLAAIGTCLVWFTHTLTQNLILAGYIIIFGLSLVEFFWSMSNIGWSALISDLYPIQERGRIQGKMASIGGIGRICGVWIGGLLYDGFGMQYEGWGFHKGALFFVAAGVMLLSIIPMLFVPEGGVKTQNQETSNSQDSGNGAAIHLFKIFLLAMVLINFGRNSIVVIQSQYLFLDTAFNVNSRMLSYIVNTESLAIILVGLCTGWIIKKIGSGKAICLGAVFAIMALLIFVFYIDLRLAFLSAMLKGTAEVIIYASSYAFASILIPAGKRGRLFGLFNATYFLSWGIAGTLITGPIADVIVSVGLTKVFAYKMAYLSATAITSLGLILQLIVVFVLLPKARQSQMQSDGL